MVALGRVLREEGCSLGRLPVPWVPGWEGQEWLPPPRSDPKGPLAAQVSKGRRAQAKSSLHLLGGAHSP